MGSLANTSRTTMIDVPAETAVRIDTILLANIDGSNAADVTVEISNDNGSTYFKIASTISVPADSTLVVVDKNTALYLEEGDNLEAGASANGDLVITVNFEILNDA